MTGRSIRRPQPCPLPPRHPTFRALKITVERVREWLEA